MKSFYPLSSATSRMKYCIPTWAKLTLILVGAALLPVKLFPQAPTLSYPSPEAFTLNTTVSLQPVSTNVNTPAFSTSQQVIASGFNDPVAIAVDASGNTYVADQINSFGFNYSELKRIPAGGGTPVIINNTSFNNISGLAVDAAGNIYVSDQPDVKEILAGSGTIKTLATNVNLASSITVDVQGNVYVAYQYEQYNNYNHNDDEYCGIIEITSAGSDERNIIFGLGAYIPGLATDAAGNLYIADFNNNAIDEVLAGNLSLIQWNTGISYPVGIAVDAVGNTYFDDSGSQSLKEIPVSGMTPITVRPDITAYNRNNLVRDAQGNFYFMDWQNNVEDEITIQTPAGGYYLSSALPGGLTFNNTTGVINGFANTVSPPTNYTVTAYNGYGTSVSANFNLQVVAPVNISYNSPQPYTVNTDIAPLTPSASGVGTPGYAGPPVAFGTGLNTPQGLAINTSGNVFVAEYSASDVKEIPYYGAAPVTFGSGFQNPTGVAVDASGYVYVADFGHSVITKLTPAGAVIGNIGTGFSNPYGVAVDAAGNVYVADWGNGAVKEIRASDGSTITLGTGFNYPVALAVDGAGNVYVTDTNNNAIKEIQAGSGSSITLGSGFSSPSGIAVDALGNIFIADYKNYLVKEIPASGGGPVTVGAGSNGGSFGVAVDGAGNVYYTDQGNASVEKIVPTGGYFVNQLLPAGLNFNASTGVLSGAASGGSPATNYTITAYNAAGAASVANVTLQVMVPAAPTVNYQSPQTLPVNTPVTTLSPSGGGVSAPAYRTNPVTLASALNNAQGMALDAAGNMYVAEYNGNDVVKIPAGGGAPSQFASGFQNPTGVAVDAAGNVYVADLGHNVVTKLSAAGANLGHIGSSLNNPYGVAVDGAGNVYVAGLGNATIAEISASDGSTVQLGSGFNNPTGVATDAAGNIYVADYGNNAIKEIQAGSGNIVTLGTGFSGPSGVVVDALGNVYVADYKNYQVKEIPAAGGGPIVIGGAPNGGPFGIAVDGAGNVYFSDQGNNAVKEIIPIGGYFISVALPSGLSLNPASGVISGAPTALSPATNYTVTAYNAGGGTSTTLILDVDLPPPPTITSISPTSGPVGTLVTITGANLNNPTAITIGGQNAILVSNDGSTLVAMVMPGATTGAVTFTNTGGSTGGSGNFTVTPTVYPSAQQGAKLMASDNTGASLQGYSVAMSADGNTAIVGGYQDNGGIGAAWIYTRSGGVWTQQGAKLVATDNSGNANQGIAVALSADGNTAVVGGYQDNSGQGAAWVYTRSGGVWTQQGSKLTGSDSAPGSYLGYSVSLSADGNTALLGGWGDNANQGAAWIFTRSSGMWTQLGSKLLATDNTGAAKQGYAVSLSADGNSALVGGYQDNSGQGAAWVYTQSGGAWTQQGSKLVGNDNSGNANQGASVALSADGNTALIGGGLDNSGQGAAWVYTRSAGVWTQQGSKLVATGSVGTSYAGTSVSLSADGTTAIEGGYADNSNQGAAWVFTQSGGVWTQQGSKLVGTGNSGTAFQGIGVALSADGSTALVGGYQDNSSVGAAWAFIVAPPPTIASFSPASGPVGTLVTINGTNLSNPSAITIGGQSAIVVSNDGSTLVAMVMPNAASGAISLTTGGGTVSGSGGFTVTPTKFPSQQQGAKLVGTGSVGQSGQGVSVALSADGNTAIIGGYTDNYNQGAVWIYTRSGESWSQQGTKLVATDNVGAAQQGYSVALNADGNTAIVGGFADNSGIGAAWVYIRSDGVWAQQGSKLVGTEILGNSQQGISVSLSADGNTAIVGGYGDNTYAGAAWVYTRVAGVWAQQGLKLVGAGSSGAAEQGNSVSLSADGNTAIVGGLSDNSNQGAAWIFARTGGMWDQQGGKLVGISNSGTAQQGFSVALSADGNTAIVGGLGDNNYQGAAWVYTRNAGVWAQQGLKLVGTGNAGAAQQGKSVSLSADGNTAVVGGHADNSEQGAIWVYTRNDGTWTQQASKLVGTGTLGVASQGLSASLSADGSTLIEGGINDNSRTGAAWVFTVSSDATLSSLAASSGTLSPGFASGTTAYTEAVTYATTTITVTPTTTNFAAAVTVNGTTVSSGTASAPIALMVGSNIITIAVTAQDGITTSTYTINVSRAAPSDATLSSLVSSGGAFDQAFSPTTTSYTETVSNATSSITLTPTTNDPNAQSVTVNSTPVTSGSPTAPLSLNVGANTFNILVTAQDGTTTQLYTVTITRSASSDATLSSLVSSGGAFDQSFSSTTKTYTETVSNATATITLTPTANDPNAQSVTVNNTPVMSGSPTAPLNLSVGPNTFNILVTAQDGSATQPYTVTITRAPSSVATLSALKISNGTLTPAYSPAITSYTTSVGNGTTSFTITPTTTDPTATVKVNGINVSSGSASAGIPLAVGPNTITTTITAQDGVTTKTYTLTVTRAASNDAYLSYLSITTATLSPVFAFKTLAYTANVPYTTTSVTVTPSVLDATATIEFNGAPLASKTPSAPITLAVGITHVTIVVTAQDGVTKQTYTLAITRAAPSNDAYLANLSLHSASLSPSFAFRTLAYTASVANTTASITVTPLVLQANATVKVNGKPVVSKTASGSIPLIVGSNTIDVVVTAQDGTTIQTYTIIVTRAGSNDAYLAGLKVTTATLSPAFSTKTFTYTSSVATTNGSVTVTPTLADVTASLITVNGNAVASKTASGAILLAIGPNTINVVVTAQDGFTKETYTITITRAAAGADSYDPGISVTKPAETVTLADDGVLVHQAVSPNGDGINDFLQIDNISQYPDNKLSIMNRNGQLIYEANGYDNSSRVFDGHSNKNGQMQLPGTYFYQLDYNVNGITKHKTGYIVLKY